MRGILGRKLINLCLSNFKRSVNPVMPTLCPLKEQEHDFPRILEYMDDDDHVVLSRTHDYERFFFSDPGRSRSIMECCSDQQEEVEDLVDPYMGFRRSMEEMVKAGNLSDVRCKSNWEYLHELLLCYLVLNPKTAHKFIDRAFSDLIFTLTAEYSPPANLGATTTFRDWIT